MRDPELNRIIESCDARAAVAFFRQMEEPDRAEIREQYLARLLPCATLNHADARTSRRQEVCKLIVFAVATHADLKDLRIFPERKHYPKLLQILKDRRPAWLSSWGRLFGYSTAWEILNHLIREKACPRPADPEFVIAMVRSFEILSDTDDEMKDSIASLGKMTREEAQAFMTAMAGAFLGENYPQSGPSQTEPATNAEPPQSDDEDDEDKSFYENESEDATTPQRVTYDLHGGLVRHPEILSDYVWELFKNSKAGKELYWHEYYAENNKTLPTRSFRTQRRWDFNLLRCALEGLIPRARLLDAVLDGLMLDASNASSWYAHFHDLLVPTLDERLQRVERYAALLSLNQAVAVDLALRTCQELLKRKLPLASISGHVGKVIAAKSKTAAKKFLSLIEKAVQAEPQSLPDAMPALIQALNNPSPEIQKQALSLLMKHADPAQALQGARQPVLLCLENLSPSVREQVQAWLEPARPPLAAREESAAGDAKHSAELDLLIASAECLDPVWAKRCGVPGALDAARGKAAWVGAIPEETFESLELPRLDPARKIRPIAELNELIERFAEVLNYTHSIENLERVLDGLSRLCHERPADFSKRTNALRKLAEKRRATPYIRPGGLEINRVPYMASWSALALAWVDPGAGARAWPNAAKWGETEPLWKQELERAPSKPHYDPGWGHGWLRAHYHAIFDCGPLVHFHTQRIRELGLRVDARRNAPLLAAPTHAGGWIDPRELVRRMQAAGSHGRFDFIQALLRLAPDHRGEALNAAQALPDEMGAALRYALGSQEDIGPTPAFWVAAARSRNPFADDPKVESRHPGLGPGAGIRARLSVQVSDRPVRDWKAFKAMVFSRQMDHVARAVAQDAELLPFEEVERKKIYAELEEARTHEEIFHELSTSEGLVCIAMAPRAPEYIRTDLPTVLLNFTPASAWDLHCWPWDLEPMLATLAIEMVHFASRDGAYGDVDLRPLLRFDAAMKPVARMLLGQFLTHKNAESAKLAREILCTAISDGRLDGIQFGDSLAQLATHPQWNFMGGLNALSECARQSPLHAQAVRRALERMSIDLDRKPAETCAHLQLLDELSVETGEAITEPRARARLEKLRDGGGGKSAKLARRILGQLDKSAEHRRAAAKLALERRIGLCQSLSRWLKN